MERFDVFFTHKVIVSAFATTFAGIFMAILWMFSTVQRLWTLLYFRAKFDLHPRRVLAVAKFRMPVYFEISLPPERAAVPGCFRPMH